MGTSATTVDEKKIDVPRATSLTDKNSGDKELNEWKRKYPTTNTLNKSGQKLIGAISKANRLNLSMAKNS